MKTNFRLMAIAIFLCAVISCEKEDQNQLPLLQEPEVPTLLLKTADGYSDYIQYRISQLEYLVEQGYLNKGNGQDLISKLKNAIKSLDKENVMAANNQLGAFINQVEAFVRNGKLTSIQGQILIQAAEQAILGDFPLWSCGQPYTDIRDGQSYETVLIGDQCWFGENLRYLPWVNNSTEGGIDDPFYYVYGYEGNDVDEASNISIYLTKGVLYNYEAALTACPFDFHLSSDDDWKVLEMELGMSSSDADDTGWRTSGNVSDKLKTTYGWEINTGNNSSGFSALPAGHRRGSGGFHALYAQTNFWTPNPGTVPTEGMVRLIYHSHVGVSRGNLGRVPGISVRCIRD